MFTIILPIVAFFLGVVLAGPAKTAVSAGIKKLQKKAEKI